MIRRFLGKKFRGYNVKATQVHKPDCLLVKGIPSGTHKDAIRYFFEDVIENLPTKQRPTRKEHVCDVKMKTENQALVYLDDYEGKAHCGDK